MDFVSLFSFKARHAKDQITFVQHEYQIFSDLELDRSFDDHINVRSWSAPFSFGGGGKVAHGLEIVRVHLCANAEFLFKLQPLDGSWRVVQRHD